MNRSDLTRNAGMLTGSMAGKGYVKWWHSFRGIHRASGEWHTFFIEYFIMNPGLMEDHLILGQLPRNKKQDKKPSYVMVKAGVLPDETTEGLQLSNYYPVSSMKVANNPFYLKIEDCVLSENRISGMVSVSPEDAQKPYLMSDDGTMEWDLEVFKAISCHTGFWASPLACTMNLLDTFFHGEGIRTGYFGTVTVNGVPFEVDPEESYGYADKHWGRSFNRPLLQLSSCRLRSKRTGKLLKYSAMVMESCQPKFLWFPLRQRFQLQVTYTGEDFCFSFDKPGFLPRIKWQKKETQKRFIWHMKAQNKKAVAKLSFTHSKDSMMKLHYESPLGIRRKTPLYAGTSAKGTLELYRVENGGLTWIDTLQIEDGLCQYQADRT